ncbi:MFS transporter [Limnoglobus roseus]|uniref:MFS transporter n=1 Tax=Limnoglobus roseus TaxID=2598579 RepID=A0A5C1AHF6_9BACT|nr:MFS transporter [Limnoglobus roseus]QEL16398.1 MFS transporter [Limnoglobus roseus]
MTASRSPERDFLDHAGVIFAVVPAMLLAGITATLTDLPRIFVVSELASDRYRFQWVTGATLLGGVVGIASLGWLAAHLGLRRCYLGGLFLYAVGSGAASMVGGTDALAVARFVQSWGNGLVATTVLAVLWREFPAHRDLGIAVFAFGIYFGRIAGPSVSTWLITHDDWRTVFYATGAAGAIGVFVAWQGLRQDAPAREPPGEFDFLGMALLIGWVLCLVIGLYRFQLWGWGRANETLAVAGLGLILFTAFLWRQFAARHPLLQLHLFARHHFAMGVISKALVDGQFFAVLAIMTRYMAVTRDYPRITTGAALLPAVAAMTVTLAITAKFGTRNNRKLRLLIGLAGMTLATWQLTRVDLFTPKEWVSGVLAAWAASVGLIASPVICIAQDNLRPEEIAGSASIKNLGLVLPGALCGGLIAIASERAGDRYFDSLRQTIQVNRTPVGDVSAGLTDWITRTHGSGPNVAELQAAQLLGRYVRATASVFADQTAFGWLTVISAATFVLACFLRRAPTEMPGPQRG